MMVWLACVFVQFLLVEAAAIPVLGDDLDLNCESKNHALRTIHLSFKQWMVTLVLGVISLPVQWILIFVSRKLLPDEKPQPPPAIPLEITLAPYGETAEARRRDKRLLRSASRDGVSSSSSLGGAAPPAGTAITVPAVEPVPEVADESPTSNRQSSAQC